MHPCASLPGGSGEPSLRLLLPDAIQVGVRPQVESLPCDRRRCHETTIELVLRQKAKLFSCLDDVRVARLIKQIDASDRVHHRCRQPVTEALLPDWLARADVETCCDTRFRAHVEAVAEEDWR